MKEYNYNKEMLKSIPSEELDKVKIFNFIKTRKDSIFNDIKNDIDKNELYVLLLELHFLNDLGNDLI